MTDEETNVGASVTMVPVNSSNIKSIGRDGHKLRVEFNNGSMWEYDEGVDHHEEMLKLNSQGKSVGSYFYAHVMRTLDGRKL